MIYISAATGSAVRCGATMGSVSGWRLDIRGERRDVVERKLIDPAFEVGRFIYQGCSRHHYDFARILDADGSGTEIWSVSVTKTAAQGMRLGRTNSEA
jgi:hypothetical protein